MTSMADPASLSHVAYYLCGTGLFCLGLYGVVALPHLLRKILALNIMGSGVFMVLMALASRSAPIPDPIPQAMVLTGIVVSVCATALALALVLRLQAATGRISLDEHQDGLP